MIEVIKSPTPVVEKKQWTAFLAGPMHGAPSWQAQAPKVAAQVGTESPKDRSFCDRYLSGELGDVRTAYVRRDTVLDSASGQSDEAMAILCHHHATGDG